jgi:hypothetical protein
MIQISPTNTVGGAFKSGESNGIKSGLLAITPNEKAFIVGPPPK